MALVYGILPARWGSTRFPGKPLHRIAGKPLIQHAWECARRCQRLARVLIATDDDRIAAVARDFGAEVEMTSSAHPTGTDRLAEVAERHPDATHFVNIQGDEPRIAPELVDLLVAAMEADPALPMATSATPLPDPAEWSNPNCVKVVLDRTGHALYFSRSAIPFPGLAAAGAALRVLRHQGLYGYTREFLLRFVSWPPSPLEQIERLEQLRALENGAKLRVIVTDYDSAGIDTPEDAARLEAQLTGRNADC